MAAAALEAVRRKAEPEMVAAAALAVVQRMAGPEPAACRRFS